MAIRRRAVGSTVQLLVEEAVELYFRAGFPLSRVEELMTLRSEAIASNPPKGTTRAFSVKLPRRVVYDINVVAALSERSVGEVFTLALEEYVASDRTPPRKADAKRTKEGRLVLPPATEREVLALAGKGLVPTHLYRDSDQPIYPEAADPLRTKTERSRGPERASRETTLPKRRVKRRTARRRVE